MQFPNWVETPARQTKAQRATKRLNFLLYRAALQLVPGANISDFAKKIGVERSTLHTYVADGAFSARMATTIEKAVGRDHTPWEWLVEPLNITAE